LAGRSSLPDSGPGDQGGGRGGAAYGSDNSESITDPKSGDQGMQPGTMPAHRSHEMNAETGSSEGAPTPVNKASSILGMKVRNQNNEYLGKIKELVIDWKTEQVAYAVLSTGGMPLFGMGGKLLAVPLTALTASADQKQLILNAEKSKVEAAVGFDSDNWPSVGNPSWGAEPFWQKETTTPPTSDNPAKGSDSKATQTRPRQTTRLWTRSRTGARSQVSHQTGTCRPSRTRHRSRSPLAIPIPIRPQRATLKPDQDPEAPPNQNPEGK